MTLHKEGFNSILITFVLLGILNGGLHYFFPNQTLILGLIGILSLVFLYLILQFFRSPKRDQTMGDNLVIAPCDGKIVVIEQTVESEFYKDKRIQVSIFMSPLNVHINWYPISGIVKYLRYHEGKFLVAWHPKASTENERTSMVIEKTGFSVMIRQIAGAVAKRIRYYPHESDKVKQGSELGFIKFGSRVDLYLPLGTKINVEIGQKTTGGVTVIAEY